jgi:hypothetical protein
MGTKLVGTYTFTWQAGRQVLHVACLQIALCSLPCGMAVLPPIAQIAQLHIAKKSRPRQRSGSASAALIRYYHRKKYQIIIYMQSMQSVPSRYENASNLRADFWPIRMQSFTRRKYILLFVNKSLANALK